MSNYLAKILGNDQESLRMIAALSSGAKVKVSNIKYLASNKVSINKRWGFTTTPDVSSFSER